MALPGNDAFAQAKSLKEQVVGTWTLVSNVNMHPDGTKFEALGPNPRGVFMLDANFVITLLGEGRRKFASNSRLESTPDENKSVVQGAIAYFGTYTVRRRNEVHQPGCIGRREGREYGNGQISAVAFNCE